MGMLDNPLFWSSPAAAPGVLQADGSLKYMLLDQTFRMQPVVRNRKVGFTDFALTDGDAKKCKIIVNGNFYGLTMTGAVTVKLGGVDDPSDTKIEGQIIRNGSVVAGDSRPQSFWFGQMAVPSTDAWGWAYHADKGDPPAGAATYAAIGGVAPLIPGFWT